ncbi:MAG: mercuric reductase [Deltaproteobacteria bacterium RBG_13_65_10]|nr:MAG: mercuric reductase [Deltaproteobacteria bacterium RBG_13_65_10]
MADLRDAERFGVRVPPGSEVDFGAVMARMRRIRAEISHHDSVDRFTKELGVDVFLGNAHFSGPDTVDVNGQTLRFKRAVVATGARPVHPSIEGLSETGFLTNETIFSLTQRPRRLAVIGGGPIGCELAQAFRRLGSEVTIVEMGPQFLPREDPDAAQILADAFRREGIEVRLGTLLKQVKKRDGEKHLTLSREDSTESLAVDEILVGVGRAPNVEGLDLEAVGVAYDGQGVRVNDRLQTSNPRIYAAGDICLSTKFTHAADFTARIVIQNALFLGRKKHSALTLPWCTYTDPEIAHVGTYADIQAQGLPVDTFVRPLREVDRALADGEEEGFVKIHVRRGTDRILGATIVARHAGEMISEISVAMAGGVGLSRLAQVIHPYPTQAEAIRQLGDAYNRTRLTPFLRRQLARWLAWTR